MSKTGAKPRILVVDDEEEIRDSLELLMTSEGLIVDAVADAETCLKQIETESSIWFCWTLCCRAVQVWMCKRNSRH